MEENKDELTEKREGVDKFKKGNYLSFDFLVPKVF